MSNLFTLNTKLLHRKHSSKWVNRQVAGPSDLPDGLASNPCGTDTGAPINIRLYSVILYYMFIGAPVSVPPARNTHSKRQR